MYEEPLHHSLLLVRSLLHAVQRINTKNNSDTPSPAAVALFNLLRTTLTDCSRGLELLTHILVNPLASILSKLAIGVTYDPVLFTPLYGRLQVLRLILAASEIHDCDDLLRQQIDTLKQSKDKVLSTLASSNTFDHRLHPLLLKCLS